MTPNALQDLLGIVGKLALVTDSGRNSWPDVAPVLAVAGAKVVVSDRTAADFAPIVEQIRNNGGEAIGILTDVENEVDVISRFAQTAAHWGTPDIAVNCAAMRNDGPLTEFTESEWDEVLSVDLKWVFFCTREGFMPPPPVCDAAATSNTEH